MFINNLAVISVAFYCGKVFGLLPLTYSSEILQRSNSKNIEQSVATVQQPKEFKSCRIGELFSYAQFCLQVWTSYIALSYLLNAAAFRSEALCAQGNFCSVFSLILSHVVVALLTIVIMPFRYRRTIDCFNKADYLLRHRLYKRRSGTSPAMTSIVMIVLLWSIAAKIIIGHVGYPVKRYGLYYTYNVAYVGPIILIGIITSLCLVCEQSFADINEHLRHLCWPQQQSMIDMTTVRSAKLRALMQHHWYVSNFVETLSDCFKLEILLVMVHIYLQLVLFLYLTLWIVFTRQIFDNAFWPCVSGLLEVSIILCKLVYFCYRCDRLVAQVKIFTMQLNCREIAITACGFFTINLALLVTITGIVLTYFLVLIQFQVDSEISRQTSLESRVVCVSWPCLEPSINQTV